MLSLNQKIGQTFIIGISGHSLTKDEKSFIIKNNIGGVALFSRNISTFEQLHALTTELHALQSQKPDKSPLFVSVDMEGGRVARLKEPFTVWPPLQKLGNLNSTSMCFEFAEKMGLELKAAGFNLDFAPCVDVLTQNQNPVIGDRSLGSDAETVAKLSSALVRGYVKSGILPCPKHFPGHGDTTVDSHLDLPIQKETTLETLRTREFLPFRKAMRARAEMIMSAHILFPKIDPVWPATLSQIFLTDLLRKELRYNDLIVTDDLDMKGLRNRFSVEQIAVRAIEAGANILLYCNEPQSPSLALEATLEAIKDKKISEDLIDKSYQMIIETKHLRLANFKTLPLQEAKKVIGCKEHKELAQNIKDGVLIKNNSQVS